MTELCCLKPKIIKTDRVLGYMGERGHNTSADLLRRVEEAEPSFLENISGKVCFCIFETVSDGVEDGSAILRNGNEEYCFKSEDISRLLAGCDKAVIMAATIGVEADRMRTRAALRSSLDELIYDALGTEAVEEVCDEFCAGIADRFGETTMRFSPGYGDLALAEQARIFRILDIPKRLGVTLTDSLLMVPTKSVTAIFGIKGDNYETL